MLTPLIPKAQASPTSAALKSFIPCSAWLSMIPPLPRTSAIGQMNPKYPNDTNQRMHRVRSGTKLERSTGCGHQQI